MESPYGSTTVIDHGKSPGGLKALVRRRLPILQWAPKYTKTTAIADLIAGITLGLTLVPQSIAYAALADLPVQYGLYSAFIGTMVYVVLGTVKEVSIGPTSLMALLTLQTCHGLPIEYVVLLTFLSGCVVLAMGLLKLGFLVDLISPAVTSGFTSATAVIIVVAQTKGLLGVSFLAESLVDNLTLLVEHAADVRVGDAALGACCCTVLLLLRKLKDLPVGPKRQRLRKTLWLVSISRNALVVFSSMLLAYCTRDPRTTTHPYFKLSGRVEPGLPPLSLPPFSTWSNGTEVPFLEMARRLSSGVLMLPVVMVLANIAIAKAFSGGSRVDATQEMVTLGLCNMLGSLVHAMPTCGAFTRSAVSHSSGVRTPLAGLYSGLITLMALAFMTQYFFYIPKACLSSVLICAVIFMIDYSTVVVLWRRSKPELCILSLTFAVSVLVTVELALLVGALSSLARMLQAAMRPKIYTKTYKLSSTGKEALVVRPTLGLIYCNCEFVSSRLTRLAAAAFPMPLMIDCRDLSLLDYSAQQALERLIKKLKAIEQKLIFFNAPADIVRKLEKIEGIDLRPLTTTSALDALGAVAAPARTAAAPAGVAAAGVAAAGVATAPARTPLLAHADPEDPEV